MILYYTPFDIQAIAYKQRYTGKNALKRADHGNAARSSQIARNIGKNE